MNQQNNESGSVFDLVLLPLKIVVWPFVTLWRFLYEHILSYVFGRVTRDEDRVYSIRFVWYGDSIYLHPMVWGQSDHVCDRQE